MKDKFLPKVLKYFLPIVIIVSPTFHFLRRRLNPISIFISVFFQLFIRYFFNRSSKFLGIKLTPVINVPRQRRIQTLAVLFWSVVILIWGWGSVLLSVFLLFTRYYWISLLVSALGKDGSTRLFQKQEAFPQTYIFIFKILAISRLKFGLKMTRNSIN